MKDKDTGEKCCRIELVEVANGVIAKSIQAYKGEYPRNAEYSKISGIIVK